MMDSHEDLHHDLLDRAVDAVLRDSVPNELASEQVAQLVAILRRAAEQPNPITLTNRIKSMKLKTRIAVAAAVLVVCFGLVSWLAPGGVTAVAFADVAQALNNVHSATWKMTSAVKLKPTGATEEKTFTNESYCMFLAPCHERLELTCHEGAEVKGKVDAISIVDGQSGTILSLCPAKKTAKIDNLPKKPGMGPPGETFLALQEFVAKVANGSAAGKVERLSPTTINGRAVESFRVQIGSQSTTIWADPKTSLPIRVEQIAKPANGHENTVVLSDFQINPDLDKSLFSLDAPPGYTLQTVQIDEPKKP